MDRRQASAIQFAETPVPEVTDSSPTHCPNAAPAAGTIGTIYTLTVVAVAAVITLVVT